MVRIELPGKYNQSAAWNRLNPPARVQASTLSIFLPFAAGYFLSYWMRTINGPLSDGLVLSFNLGPRDLGLLTSLYFLAFAAFQIPAGLLIDRYGPRRVQALLFLIAAAGAFIFATAEGRAMLMLGRTLIGLGCSAALVAGFKALGSSLPPERRAMGNCCLVTCGGLGAMASAAPVGAMLDPANWRAVFMMFAIVTVAVSGVVWIVVPEPSRRPATPYDGAPKAPPAMTEVGRGFATVVMDRRFWRVAPLSATVVGSAFAIHGLWAARWLSDVNGDAPAGIAIVLLTMGASLTLGAVLFGVLATRLRSRGVTTTRFFGWACVVFLLIETTLASGAPIPPVISLGAFALFGAITVLSFTIMGELFPSEMAGRANAALNVLHLGAAFAAQVGIGVVVSFWPPPVTGHTPATAYSVAFALLIATQAAALIWFAATSSRNSPFRPWPSLRLVLAGLAPAPATAVKETQR